jgi:hypothetical protein
MGKPVSSVNPGGGGVTGSGAAVGNIDMVGFRITDSTDELNLGTSAAAGSATAVGDVICGGALEVDGILYPDGGVVHPAAGTSTYTGRVAISAPATGRLRVAATSGSTHQIQLGALAMISSDSTSEVTAYRSDGTTYGTFVGGVFVIANTSTMLEGRFSATTGVDLNVTTKTTLFTVPTGKTAYITKIVVRDASASLTTASFGFGYNANADDVVASATHTTLTGGTLYEIIRPAAGALEGAAAAVFGVKCTIAQGSAATVVIDVFGYVV